MERKDKFINGVFFNKPRQDWITANISIKYPQIIQEIKRL